MKLKIRSLALAIAALTVLACGGGGTGVSDGGGGSEIPVEERTAVIESIEQKGMELAASGLTVDEQNAQLADFMADEEHFAEVKVTPEQNVFGRFTDGRLFIYVNNRFPDFATGVSAPTLVRDNRQAMANPIVSTSKRARLFHSFGLGFNQQQHPIDQMGQYLTDAGYTLNNPAEGDARLATLRSVSGDGFFYLNSHGFGLELSDTEKTYGVGSSTLRTDDNERLPEIKDDLDNKRILYATAPNGESWSLLGKTIPKVDTRYAITHRFVEKHMSFGQNAVVFINACWSGFTGVDQGAQAFMLACFQKGAGTYLGWTNKVATPVSEQAPLYFVDRLCGANDTDPEEPKQRPFFVDEIVANMKSKGLANSGSAELIVKNRVANTTIGVRPTIESLMMIEHTSQLALFGQFGPAAGEVFVGGQPATNVVWGPNEIFCEIPKSGEGSHGEVMVKAHGKESNKRMLTLWTGPFSYTETSEGSLKKTATGTLKFRSDFAKIRKKPGAVPNRKDPVPIFLIDQSTLTWQASGEHRDDAGKLIERWSGGGTPPYSFSPITSEVPTGNWTCSGAYDPAGKKLYIALINGDKWTKTEPSKTTELLAFAVGNNGSAVDQTTWIVSKFDTGPGDERWSFGPFLPSSPPTDEMLLGID